MRKSRKSRTGGGSPVNLQNLIVLLLLILIIINFFDFYLNHFGGTKATNPKITKQEIAATPLERPIATGKKASPDSLKTVSGSMVAALNKPAPLLTPDMPLPGEIQLQVLNGCGTPGVAGKVRGVLRQRGFDVLSFGNANSQNYDNTVIWARSELPFSDLAARRLANSLGISADQVSVHENLGMGDIDVTLIIGSDYQKLDLAGR